MERRTFIQRLFKASVLGGLFLLVGCKGKEKPVVFRNQEKLWQLVSEEGKIEEPIELTYSKETPVLYRDASMGKVDPNFVPRLTGG